MKAINRYIIVDKIKTEPKKVAGLIMTDSTDVDNRYLKAKIVSCGNLVEGLKDGDNLGAERMNNSEDADYVDTVNGQYQTLASGVDIRFAGDTADTATINDKWEIEFFWQE